MSSPQAPSLTTEERVLEAARACILDLGWGRTTLTEVARRAGVSRMTVYRRWDNMGTLLADLLTSEWQEILAGVPREDRTTPAGLAATVAALTADSRANPLLRRVEESDPEVLLPYLRERPGRSGQLMLDLLVGAIRQGQRAGSIRAGDPEVLARAILLTSYGFHWSVQTMGSPRELAAEQEELVRRYLQP